MKIQIGGGFWTSMLSGAIGVAVGIGIALGFGRELPPEYRVENDFAVMTWTFKNQRPPDSQELEWEKQTISDFFNALSISARATSYPEINKVMHLRIQLANARALEENLDLLQKIIEILYYPDTLKILPIPGSRDTIIR